MVDDAVYAVNPATDGLLLNWGRWSSGRNGGAASSGMWRFASRGSRVAAYAPTANPVDTDQARMVEQVVCHPQFSPMFRDLLKAHYVVNAHPNRTCSALGLHHQAYAQWVWRATVFFRNRFDAAHPHTLAAAA